MMLSTVAATVRAMTHRMTLTHPALPGGVVELEFIAGQPPLRIEAGGAFASWDGHQLDGWPPADWATATYLRAAVVALRDAKAATAAAREIAVAAAREAMSRGVSEAMVARVLGVDRSRTLRVWLGKTPRTPAAASAAVADEVADT
jgi:hypothetical protein